jgi:hypothetical protein
MTSILLKLVFNSRALLNEIDFAHNPKQGTVAFSANNGGGMLMTSAATYNRNAQGTIWNLSDLPAKSSLYQILLKGDLDHNVRLGPAEADQVDWDSFSNAVKDFQTERSIHPQDGKLGPATLHELRECYRSPSDQADALASLGNLAFRPAAVPVSPPPGSPLTGGTPEEKSVCSLWNKYGAAIYHQAQTHGLPVETALAVFFVESQMAYHPATGLIIIRFEPRIFQKYAGQSVTYTRGGQGEEWQNLGRAYDLDADAALLSTSYGLPQLMGFNWQVTRHPDVRAMVLAFQNSCEEQVAGFFGFVEHNSLVRYIRAADWRGFTKYYNGPGNIDVYSGKLTRALMVVNSLKATGARFVV